MLRRFAAVSAIAVSLTIPAQAALANVQPIDRCVEKPHCILTTLPEAIASPKQRTSGRIALQQVGKPQTVRPKYRGSGRDQTLPPEQAETVHATS